MKKLTCIPCKNAAIWLLKIAGAFLILILVFFSCVNFGIFGKLPSIKEIQNPNISIASEIITEDDILIGKIGFENRTQLYYYQLPQNLIQALIATEDERFYNHFGIDLRSTFRAVLKPGTGGASTITQQLAKNLFTKNASANVYKRVLQKMKEWVIAVKIEHYYTKNEILTMYLNNQDFVFNAVGIQSAAKTYFDKNVSDLKTEEAAVLVGMLKNPILYNPNIERYKHNSLERRNLVLNQMYKNNFITSTQRDSLQKIPLQLNFGLDTHYTGNATYLRSYIQKVMQQWARNYEKTHGKKYNIYRDGLKIYVTINSTMQQYAEEAMLTHMANLQKHFSKEQAINRNAPFYNLTNQEITSIIESSKKNSNRYKKLKKLGKTDSYIDSVFKQKTQMRVFTYKGEKDTLLSPLDSIKYYKYYLRSGLVAIEPQTGYIKAWVGGLDYQFFKYDAVEQQTRQVGSTFKPFVYALAFDRLDISPCKFYENVSYTIPRGKYGLASSWTPANSGGGYGGFINLKTALAKSINVISAKLIDDIGPKHVVSFAHKLGVKNHIPTIPSIALGAVDLSLLEMVSSYSAFANKGYRTLPIIIKKIEDKNGKLLQEFKPDKEKALSEEAAYLTIDALKEVTNIGSASRLRSNTTTAQPLVTGFPYLFDNPIASKTGTSQNQSDGWFIGMVPNLVTGVWTGGEDRAIHFKSTANGQGATMSLPTWALFMKKCYNNPFLSISNADFQKPAKMNRSLDCPEFYINEENNELKDLENSIFENNPNP